MTTFIYKCTNCRTKNETTLPPADCMLHCSKCGFMTVQTCERVSTTRLRMKRYRAARRKAAA